MPIVLWRIDNRLIHAQVVEGWVPSVDAGRVVVVSDEFAVDGSRQQMTACVAPEGLAIEFLDMATATSRFNELADDPLNTILLFPAPQAALAFISLLATRPRSINVGGMHYAMTLVTLGRFTDFSTQDKEALTRIVGLGVKLDARSTPWDKSVDLAQNLK